LAQSFDEIAEELRASFPHGHPEFLPMLLEKMKLHSDKNHDYAKGGRPLGNFERVAAILGQYPGLKLDDPVIVMLVYMLKQVDATLHGFAQGITQKVEGPIDRLGDVLVYSGIAICALKDRAASDAWDRAVKAGTYSSPPTIDEALRESPTTGRMLTRPLGS
jgi:hypothetical protein